MARARRCTGRVGARKIGAACNAFAEKAMERSAEARSAEVLRKGEARRAEAKFWARKISAVCNALANKSVEKCRGA